MTFDNYMQKAERALSSANLLLTSGDVEGACNRAYYAMYDAAHAALLASGIDVSGSITKTHRGLIGAFGLHIVQGGYLPREFGRLLNEVEQVRLLADYTGEEVSIDRAVWVVEQATGFVGTIRQTFAQ
ncbi:MAG TPA: HEPN domain-containing protein [Candidatus Thiothrix moscowensis]|uniref:HEPN domain-containing protein n=1 Tax=unclassified Thiothrix TaxID=2636184 RepID=UPI0025EED447|nr:MULTISPECIES: HEPN domain-containing protein [unclassified Thiothrix]HRJ53794.1 HEPN domain-containing protein [Candidatus Thiothrix moscowensis]HRJ93876.1 HEPN domain-containing protein [Candidatus Thiothrix moscowensis]